MARAVAPRSGPIGGSGKAAGLASEGSEAGARLRSSFVAALAADYEAHGAAAIAALREERPQDYVKLVASLLPKDIAAAEGGEDGSIPVAIEVRFVGAG